MDKTAIKDKIARLKLRLRAYEAYISQLEAKNKLLEYSISQKIDKKYPIVDPVPEQGPGGFLPPEIKEACRRINESAERDSNIDRRDRTSKEHVRDVMNFEYETKRSASLNPEEFRQWLHARQED
jgi:hypothetical protein